MILATYNELLEIQERQIAYWHKEGKGPLGINGVAKIKQMTKPCPFDPDELRPIKELNELIPRGGDIERVMGFSTKSILAD